MTRSYAKPLVIITAIVAIAASVVAVALTPSDKLPKAVKIDTTTHPVLGNPKAPVKIVIFEDLKCPVCKIYSNTVFPKIKQKYIDTGIANYSMVTLAFLPGSIPAGNAALCLFHQNKKYFFPFVEYVYKNQPPETQDWATIPNLLKYAKASVPQADSQKLSNCIFMNEHTPTLQANLKKAAKVMNNQVATPSLYINGRLVRPLTMKRVDTLVKAAQQGQ